MTDEHRHDSPDARMDRRRFLQRSVTAGAAAVATGALGLALHDPTGPKGARPGDDLLSGLPSFAVSDGGPALSVVTGTDRTAMLERALVALGGIERFIRPGDRVLIKVNAGFATPPEIGATTHPDLVTTLGRLCRAVGAEHLVVTDYPVNDPHNTFDISGIAAAADAIGARLVLPRAGEFRPLSLPGSKLIQRWPVLVGPFEGVTKCIGVCPVKNHVRAGATLSMKNWYGLLGGRRAVFHQDVNAIVRDLARLVRPTFVVVDGTWSMVANGPTGGSLSDLAATSTMVVSTDQVAADTLAAGLLGLEPKALPYLGMAAAAGLGRDDPEALHPLRAHVDS